MTNSRYLKYYNGSVGFEKKIPNTEKMYGAENHHIFVIQSNWM